MTRVHTGGGKAPFQPDQDREKAEIRLTEDTAFEGPCGVGGGIGRPRLHRSQLSTSETTQDFASLPLDARYSHVTSGTVS